MLYHMSNNFRNTAIKDNHTLPGKIIDFIKVYSALSYFYDEAFWQK